mmetsp:Transcript_2848/g.7827  ORF Transcript_2848/g.7827 Transcript_2848/m.7827 type:complete len:763 (+) Transcript_2848:120-2408(+)|eukprot:CAMPEP_0197186904 /NCGR_PEP_ID=MMETSP1423-20130617/14838_1 /TAXON_ID=476441 /ORGANISM="Pseudo-nitzschia heimii, Strain UNC1101" /LENGTH=762 /DNA_ID=CAMNT_0042638339 /DNA_START=40 /DNA_END=2328 /DNA_ORIENTATION=-
MDESSDTDMENATPETKYFKMMMEDNEIGRVKSNDNADEDSIIGGQTIASLMEDANHSRNARVSTTGESVSQVKDVGETNLSIIGYDDVSTLGNDTANETTKELYTGNGDRKDRKPRIRLFKEYNNEYKTPEKKKRSGNQIDDDDQTQPETPPGMISVPSSNRSTSSIERKEGKLISGNGNPLFLHSKRVYIVAGVLALILFVSIIALAVALKGVRGEENTETPSVAINSSPNIDRNEILDSWPDLDTVIKNDKNNSTEADLVDLEPVLETPQPSLAVQTTAPSLDLIMDSFTQFTFDEAMDLLLERGALSSENDLMMNLDSPQYYATAWISQDPNFYGYTQDRLVQRWTLAIIAKSLDSTIGVENPLKHRKLQNEKSDFLRGWLSYTDECTWFSSSAEPSPCDQDGMYQIVDLHDMSLLGTLPSELAMLSNSLQHLNLDGNELTGSIPKELEELTNLISLRLRRNNLEKDLSIDFAELTSLQILDLGENSLTGYLPYNILYLDSPIEIYLDSNKFEGNIPYSIGDLSTLTTLALDDNDLSGWIPDSISDLVNLETLTLGNNYLKGTLSNEVCLFDNLEVLIVDCAEQGCECCTECANTNSPSSTPTDLQTLSPTDLQTLSPSASPSTSPSSAPIVLVPSYSPTVCVDEISILDFCFAPSAHIGVSFTNCEPERDDWVGIYRVNDSFEKNSMSSPEMWSWTCGTRNCRESAAQKIIPLNEIHAEDDKWPLEPGIYVAILARNTAMPYTAYAVSDTFVVASQC